jgi:hypothetical protein
VNQNANILETSNLRACLDSCEKVLMRPLDSERSPNSDVPVWIELHFQDIHLCIKPFVVALLIHVEIALV